MSSVLRKKIEAGAGIPPMILQFHEFWEPLQLKAAAWMSETFGIETKAVPDVRRVVPGNIAANQLDGLISFVFNSKSSPGLCAVAIDPAGAALSAAQRLEQSADSLEGLSPLFQKLLFETPAIALWRLIANGFGDHVTSGTHAPLSDYPQAAGEFDPAQRYLMVAFSCAANGRAAQVWIVFSLDYVENQALVFAQHAARQLASASSKGRETLRESVKSTTITLEGVLDRIPMTIGQCSRLEVGQIVALPDVDTARVWLEAETVNGSVDIGHCEMGVWKRQRALKLKTPILEPFTQELAKL